MAEEKPNPLTSHLLNMVQGRQQAEVAKLTLLSAISDKLDAHLDELRAIGKTLAEVAERMRER